MKSSILASSHGLWLAVSMASTASAQEVAPIALTLTPSGADTSSATFLGSRSGIFVDSFVFTPAALAGNVAVSFAPVSGPVTLFAALLNDEGFGFEPERGATTFSFQANVTADTPLALTILGYAGDAETLTDAAGSYRATITATTVAVIPEPETYALMLGGLALLAATRRRRTKAG